MHSSPADKKISRHARVWLDLPKSQWSRPMIHLALKSEVNAVRLSLPHTGNCLGESSRPAIIPQG